MRYRKRTYYTEEQKALMWDRWQEGDSFGASFRVAAVSARRYADALHDH
jgi:hypothetical protein